MRMPVSTSGSHMSKWEKERGGIGFSSFGNVIRMDMIKALKFNLATRFGAVVAVTLFLATAASGADKAGEPKGSFAKYGTNKVYYVVEGKGDKAIVLVHCWSGNLGFWDEQASVLAKQTRVVRLDLPGHGQSDKPYVDYTMDYFAGAVLAVMREAKVEKATLVGHSMGAPVICRVYKQAPERVAALVSVDGTLRKLKMPSEQLEPFLATFRAPDYKEKARAFFATMFPVPGTEQVRDRVLNEMFETPQYVAAGAMEAMFKPDEPDWDPHHVNAPVIVMNAPNPMWNDEYKEYVKSLSDKTEYRAFEGVGHWLMLEKPAEFNAALLEMLGKYGLIGK